MLSLFFVLLLLCGFPLFLCYSWYLYACTYFSSLLLRYSGGFPLFYRFLGFSSLPFQTQCGIGSLWHMLY